MLNLAFRSVVVLGVLWGMVFAVVVAAMTAMGAEGPMALAFGVGMAIAIGLVQYLISPFIIQWIHKINWVPVDSVSPEIAAAIGEVCRAKGIREPRFGIIEDGNPNAFTFGHHPGNARLVVTRGLLDVCDGEECRAVALHEMGHIVHWDFVVMTIAATVPLVLWMIYRYTLGGRRGSRRDGGYVALVGLMAFVFYWISQYVVLFLSRVREYYADRFAATTQGNPNALASGLIKIAYGLARAAKEADDKEDKGAKATLAAAGGMKSMGIFDPGFGASMALAAAGSYSQATGSYDTDTTTKAMRWDLWNPWAMICELSSSHPLPAKRIQALGKLSEKIGQKPAFELPEKAPESYWDEFWTDVAINYLPLIGFLLGLGVAFGLGVVGAFDGGEIDMLLAPIGAIVAGTALGSLIRVVFAYPKTSFPNQKVASLVEQVKVSRIRSIPATLKGKIIGRGIPGLYWSEDLVVQDESGFMVCDYRQPIRLLETLFGLFRAESLVGQEVTVTGWYRRFPRPYLELWKASMPNGNVHTAHNWAVSFYGSLIFSLLGVGALLFGLIMQMGG